MRVFPETGSTETAVLFIVWNIYWQTFLIVNAGTIHILTVILFSDKKLCGFHCCFLSIELIVLSWKIFKFRNITRPKAFLTYSKFSHLVVGSKDVSENYLYLNEIVKKKNTLTNKIVGKMCFTLSVEKKYYKFFFSYVLKKCSSE